MLDASETPSPHKPSEFGKAQLLFRAEILDAHSAQWLGAIRLVQPISSTIIAVFGMIVACALLVFIGLGSVTKRAHIVGVTVPSRGSLSVAAPSAGVIVKNFAAEGQAVAIGTPLFELSTERRGGGGEITALVDQQLAIRRTSLGNERRAKIALEEEKRGALQARQVNLDSEIEQLDREIAIAKRRQSLGQESLNKFDALQRNGFVSGAQFQQKQEELLDINSRLVGLERTKVQLGASHLAIKAERDVLSRYLATEMTQIDRAEASLVQESIENQGRKSSIIAAPEDGTVTAITNQVGQSVNSGQVIATLVPNRSVNQTSELEAHLYAPSRTAGFVAPGQIVRIRYQAFPYQKFGIQEGEVIDISRTPFAPNELPINIASTILSSTQHGTQNNGSEAMYRIKVKLARQNIDAYGKAQLLKPGMTLEADVVQDTRKIWEWIIEPILALSNR